MCVHIIPTYSYYLTCPSIDQSHYPCRDPTLLPNDVPWRTSPRYSGAPRHASGGAALSSTAPSSAATGQRTRPTRLPSSASLPSNGALKEIGTLGTRTWPTVRATGVRPRPVVRARPQPPVPHVLGPWCRGRPFGRREAARSPWVLPPLAPGPGHVRPCRQHLPGRVQPALWHVRWRLHARWAVTLHVEPAVERTTKLTNVWVLFGVIRVLFWVIKSMVNNSSFIGPNTYGSPYPPRVVLGLMIWMGVFRFVPKNKIMEIVTHGNIIGVQFGK